MAALAMSATRSTLLYDRDADFRETLKNVLLAAGCEEVESVGRLRDFFVELRKGAFASIVVTLSRPLSTAERFAALARRLQPHATLLFLVSAADAPLVGDRRHAYAIRERAFAVLPDLTNRPPPGGWRH
jgi:hypothetical protein